MKKHFKTPKDAESHYFPEFTCAELQSSTNSCSVEVQTDPIIPTQTDEKVTIGTQTCSDDHSSTLMDTLNELSTESILQVLSNFFTKYTFATSGVSVPDDFLTLSAKAMAHLKSNDRNNVLYNLAKGLGTPRHDGSDSRFESCEGYANGSCRAYHKLLCC